jgi:hypothetical protein
MTTIKCIFREAGNGYPAVGEEVVYQPDGDEPRLMKVIEMGSIQTRQWAANWCECECEDADRSWDDLSESERDEMYRDGHHVSDAE